MDSSKIFVIGGGAAGFFGALACASANPSCKITIFEKHAQLLSKVRVSGGGRCNVTHDCYDPAKLIQSYPRGSRELRGAFSKFQPQDTIAWFKDRGVFLKAEKDGRMFPVTDSSQTIIDIFLSEAKKYNISIQTGKELQSIEKSENGFKVKLGEETLYCDKILIASGSNPKMFKILQDLGHKIVSPVPSLFTFHIDDFLLQDMAGTVVEPAQVKIKDTDLVETGPVLITHWGLSGPAILRLSAWGARILHDKDYQATLMANWLPKISEGDFRKTLQDMRQNHGKKVIVLEQITSLPKKFARKVLEKAGIAEGKVYAQLSQKELEALLQILFRCPLIIKGKSLHKEEFVTCGGLDLTEVDFRTMQSRVVPGIFFAGEVLNIDGITGGFNFQSAWTTSWIAGNHMSQTTV